MDDIAKHRAEINASQAMTASLFGSRMPILTGG
jgi:hypothetical protein